MSLAPGARLGAYEVLALVGAGGMGEVYRARDRKLNRDVALKILPDAFASDPERLTRLTREAQTLAALNHPNIAQIHGLEESGGVRALVMELVEGEDLAHRIAHGAIPLDEALPIAKQIAEALEAAHEAGIIHRDLKPANIKVRPDGTVKVLDFGLAKALDPASSSPTEALSNSPTITTPAATRMGVILGTAAYMSPEQARGKTVDRRADIWAFGCVLYEMLTGKRAYGGDEVTDTLALILTKEPDWDSLSAGTPTALRRLLRHCLEKDPKRRLRDIGDVQIDLENALADPTAATPAATSVRGTRLAWVVAAAAVLAGLVLAVPAVRYLREAPPSSPPEVRVEISTPATSDPMSFALSPDGRQLVFVASGDGPPRLWLRSLAATSTQALAGTDGASHPFWSPDNRSVGFFADAKVKRLDLGTGQPRVLADAVGRGGTWNADGVILFARTTNGPLFRVSASGGTPVAVTKLDRQRSHQFPSFLPDGRHFLFYALGTPDTAGIYLGALDAADTTRLTAADVAGVYLPSGQTSLALRTPSGFAGACCEGGWLAWVRAGTLVAQRLDLTRRTLAGDPVTVADPVAFDAGSYVGAVTVSGAGLVAYRPGGANRRQLTWFDRSGKTLGVLGAPDENNLSAPRLSPDGRRVVVWRTVQGNPDVWLLDGARTSRFTFDTASDRYPFWSPDGSRIVFDSNRKRARNLYMKASGGAGSEDLILDSPQDKAANDWSADGRLLLYQSIDSQTNRDLWVLPLEARDASSESKTAGRPESAQEHKPWVFLKTPFNERWAQFSPDGRWAAYMSNESGRDEIYVRPFEEPAASAAKDGATSHRAGGQWQVSTVGGSFPRWRPDGKELYYLGPNGQMMATPIAATGTKMEPGVPVTLFQTHIFGGGSDNGQGRQYDVARDGRFLINSVLDEAAAPITLIQNWNPPEK